jgi:hypothetical protein
LEAVAVIVKVPVVLEENVAVNLPSEPVVPEEGFNDGPGGLQLRLTEAPGKALPPEVTVTVIVEDWDVVMLLGLAETWTERLGVTTCWKLAVSVIGPFIVIVAGLFDPL